MNYVKRGEVLNKLGIHYQTLYKMEKDGLIDVTRTAGGHRLYNLAKYLRENNMIDDTERIKVCYCRVSSNKQKDDLRRQIKYMKQKYPEHKIIKDIGSGINFKRDGLKKLINLIIEGKVEEIVVTYKDRLARIGYDIIEWLLEEYSDGKIKIINKKEEETPEEEITKDIIQIMTVYVAKMNGRRSNKNKS